MSLHGAIAGYAYAKFDFPGKNIMFALLMVAMMVPVQVTIVAPVSYTHLGDSSVCCLDFCTAFWY